MNANDLILYTHRAYQFKAKVLTGRPDKQGFLIVRRDDNGLMCWANPELMVAIEQQLEAA